MDQKSENSYVTRILPPGKDTSNYNLQCNLLVYDSYQAYSSISSIVNVTKSDISSDNLLAWGKYNYFTIFDDVFC